MALVDDLIERYGSRAILTVHPSMPGGAAILRWVLMIDGEDVPMADIRIVERNGRSVMLITDGREEIRLRSWRIDANGGGAPGSVVDTLGALQRRNSRD